MVTSKIARLLDQLEKSHNLAASSYTRYTWRPATETGKKDYARYEAHLVKFEQTMEQLRHLLGVSV